ncbi:hypothetical protein [Calothrix sp. PCC 7507]|uniref:hypothetical protein n=1 Tax=Calothrix sp. PCC 7507 TaxID=99598 RepID=UPI0005AB7BC6|nr:hypothetical protein [Calothrix sp. PCC 7507]
MAVPSLIFTQVANRCVATVRIKLGTVSSDGKNKEQCDRSKLVAQFGISWIFRNLRKFSE